MRINALGTLRRMLWAPLIRGAALSAILSGVALLAGVGCGADEAEIAERRARALLVVTESGPNSLDIHGVGANRQTYGLSWNVYDRLLTYGVKPGPGGTPSYDYRTLQPELAERWEVAADGRSITFHLRQGARFHDGSPVTAEDVKWSFDRAVSVGGFPTFQMKAGSLEKPEQFEVTGEHTFVIHLLRADKLTLPDLAVPVPVVINSRLARQHATTADPWAMAWLKVNAAASGAYRIESWRPGQQTVYVRNDDWASGPLPALKRVVVREVPSPSAQLALLTRGDADVVVGLAPHDLAKLAAQGSDVNVVGVPVENALQYLGMNVTKPPFDDVRVRRAVAYALPYEQMMRAAMFGRALPMFGAQGEPTASWPQPSPYVTDMAKARALLAESGHAQGFETELSFDQGFATTNEPMALLIQESLAEIGIRVSLNKIPGANWRGALLRKDLPLVLNAFGGWLNYPEYFFYWCYHGQNAVFNTMSYKNAELDRSVDAARFEADATTYDAQIKDFVRVAFEDVPRIPLFQPMQDVALRQNVRGYTYWFHRQLDFRSMSKEAASVD
jgi:peptide/nickel transport system substrate-binding protein